MLWRVGLGAKAPAPEADTHSPVDMQLLQHFAALEGPVRTLAWPPPSPEAPGNPSSRHLLAVAGHSDRLHVWDTKCRLVPMQHPSLPCRATARSKMRFWSIVQRAPNPSALRLHRDVSAPALEASLQERWKMDLHWLGAPAGAWLARRKWSVCRQRTCCQRT